MSSVRDLLRAPAGGLDLADVDTRATPGAPGDKATTQAALEEQSERLFDLGERLFAQGYRRDDAPRVLVVLQGMDGSGKGGVVKHVGGQLNPQVVSYAAFGKPTEEELAHHFLWRIRKRVPRPARIGFFDRSHYEDVLVVRVHDLVPPEVWEGRYEEINAFERELAAAGVVLVKCCLAVSPGEQLDRMQARLERPDKIWKFNPGDLDEHAHWDAYMEAYRVMLERCSPTPWYVIPGDRKWYRNWAIQQILCETLEEMGLEWPARPDLDVEALTARIDALR